MVHYYVHKNLSVVPIFRQSTPRLFIQDDDNVDDDDEEEEEEEEQEEDDDDDDDDDDDNDHITIIIFIIHPTPRSSNHTLPFMFSG